jgi:hypothetical protein
LIVGSKTPRYDKTQNQDYYSFEELASGWVVIALADGAGSKALSHFGAELAVKSAMDSLRELTLACSLEDVAVKITEAMSSAHAAIEAMALGAGTDARLYATTLVVVCANSCGAVAQMVGDGLVVVCPAAHPGTPSPLLRPVTGESVELAHFITQKSFEDNIKGAVFSGAWRGLAVQSDGLEKVTYWRARDELGSLTYETLFSILRNEGEEAAQNALDGFLGEESVKTKCYDDLSLVCAVCASA